MDLLPETSSFFWKANRAKSYEHWPFQSSNVLCNPEGMAAAGFLAIGNKEEPDLVECFICGKQLDGWEESDDPWQEHVKHQPQCPFIKLNKPDETHWTVDDLLNLFKKFAVRKCTQELETAKKTLNDGIQRLAFKIPDMYKESQTNCKDVS